jgi:ubiquinone/menaquinone biosynthesis C-methylase UbiE
MVIESLVDVEYTQSIDSRLDSYDAYIAYQMQEARRAIPFLSRFISVQGTHVLELGTGLGGKGIAYSRAGMDVVALDLDDGALEIADRTARAHGAAVRFLSADGTRLPFVANHFDAILLDSVIEHVSDPLALLQECVRVLKANGVLFVVFPPFYGPLSGHIDDYITTPWFHLLPGRIVEKALAARKEQIGFLTPRDAFEVYSSLNRLTLFKFKKIARRARFRTEYLRVRPFLTHPGTRFAVGLVAALKHPPRLQNLGAVLARARGEFDFGTVLLFLLLSALAPLVFIPLLQEFAAGGCKAVLRKDF